MSAESLTIRSPQRSIDAAVWIIGQFMRRGGFRTSEYLARGLGCVRTLRRDMQRVSLAGVRYSIARDRSNQFSYAFNGWAEEVERAA